MSSNQKGSLIATEGRLFNIIQKYPIMAGGCFCLAMSIVAVIYLSQHSSWYIFYDEPPIAAIIVFGIVLLILLGIECQIVGIRKSPIRIYENGYTLCHPPLLDVLRREEKIIPWDRVRWLEEHWVPGSYKGKFLWTIVWEDDKNKLRIMGLTHNRFKESENEKLLQKLKEVREKYVLKRGLQKPKNFLHLSGCPGTWVLCA